MDKERKFTRQQVSDITGIPFRRVLFYAEQPGLLKRLKTPGRGVVRKYNRLDIFELFLIKEFQDHGLSLVEIGEVLNLMQGLRDKWWDEKAQDFKRGPLYFVRYKPKAGGGSLPGCRTHEMITLNMKGYKGAVVVDVGAVIERMPG